MCIVDLDWNIGLSRKAFSQCFRDRDEIRPLRSSVLYLLSAICLSVNCLTVICLSVKVKMFCFRKRILIYKMIIAKTVLRKCFVFEKVLWFIKWLLPKLLCIQNVFLKILENLTKLFEAHCLHACLIIQKAKTEQEREKRRTVTHWVL